MRFNAICVIGLGYIGLPTASTLAAKGVPVLGVDVNERVLRTLRAGEIHIHEQGLREVFRGAVEAGKLTLAAQPAPADAFIISVPTPLLESTTPGPDGRADKRADMSAVISATESVVDVLRPGNLVVLESTSPPGTTKDVVAPILERSGLVPGSDFHLAYSPERVLPGQILKELRENARVVGGVDRASASDAAELYRLFAKGAIIETDATTAEFVKLMENTYRDVNIAIANEFARLADKFAIDIWQAISLANRHPRVNILKPGPGVGGHCISVDPWFLVESAPALTPLISTARRVNDAQPSFVVQIMERALGSLTDRNIAALGLAYKPNVDDLRESPAVEVARLLAREGAHVTAWEPFRQDATVPGVFSAGSLEAALSTADAILLLVAHSEFSSLKPSEVVEMTRARVVVDTVHAWNPETWRAAGFDVFGLGLGEG